MCHVWYGADESTTGLFMAAKVQLTDIHDNDSQLKTGGIYAEFQPSENGTSF